MTLKGWPRWIAGRRIGVRDHFPFLHARTHIMIHDVAAALAGKAKVEYSGDIPQRVEEKLARVRDST